MGRLETTEDKIAVKFLGWISILLVVFVGLYLLGTIGYNTYISATKEKIEVRAENSNFID